MSKMWSNLSSRERLLVGIGVAVFAVFFLFQFVYAPFSDWRNKSASGVERSQAVYELVVRASALNSATGGDTEKNLEAPLRDVLTQTASPNSINLNFVNTRPDGQIDASTAATDPKDLFAWLEVLEKNYGITVKNADIARERGESASVRAQLTFSR